MSLYTPIHVTEADVAPPWLDCTWASGLMLAQKATLGAIPGTRDEREALRRASGDSVGGSSLDDLSRGTQARYGWPTPRFGGSVRSLRDALAQGGGAELQGIYARLPKHFTRWDTRFAAKGAKSYHATYGQDYRPATDDILWMDPLARRQPGGEQWQGERMPWSVVEAFLLGTDYVAVKMQGQHAATVPVPEPDPTLEGDDEMFNIAPSKTFRDAVLKPGTVLYRDSKLTRRYSRVDDETPLGFSGSGKAFHVVVNAGSTNYVRRADVDRIVANERTYA